MKNAPGRSGLIMEEPLLWEKGKVGRSGMSIPESDVPSAPFAEELCGSGPDFPDLSEVDVVRHYTRLVDLKKCGVDVLHLNLHKTFSTPHGGGGPGAGPVCVVEELAKFLPSPRVEFDGTMYHLEAERPSSVGRMHGFHGNYAVLVRALCYILSMGAENLKKASQYAVLNASYIKVKLKDHLHLAYNRPCMHEAVFTDKKQQEFKVSTLDIAKRLMDSGYHPPTIYFPLVVSGAIMIEPTETESLEELDTFIEVVKEVVREAETDPDLLHNSPQRFKVKRLDETQAARNPCLRG